MLVRRVHRPGAVGRSRPRAGHVQLHHRAEQRQQPGITYPFVSAWEKNNGTSNFTLKYGNANSGSLTTTYSGSLPSGGYSPMRLENSVLLGTGGGNDDGDTGEFFEGAVTAGFPSDATENAVQSELTSVVYGAATTTLGFPSGYHRLVVGNDGLCLDSYGSTSNGGAAIDQWPCNGQANQQLQFTPVSNGYGELQVQNSGQDVTVANSSTTAGQPDIVQEPADGSAASLWRPRAAVRWLVAVPEPEQRAVPGCARRGVQPGPATGPVAVQERSSHQPGLHAPLIDHQP